MKSVLKRIRDRIVVRLRAFLRIPPNFVGQDGCLRAAASFVTWNQVEGDYLEFGVWKGHSFCVAYHQILSERANHFSLGYDSPEYNRWKAARPRFFAFDSFQGLPEGDGDRMVDYGTGAYAGSLDEFRKSLNAASVNPDDVVVVQGFYDETCVPEVRGQLGLEKAAIVLVDCDLYESTVPVLDFLTDLVQQGTVVIFHDWFRFKGSPDRGEQRACNEWLARNPHIELTQALAGGSSSRGLRREHQAAVVTIWLPIFEIPSR